MRWSLEAKFHCLTGLVAILAAMVAVALQHWLEAPWASVALAALVAISLSILLTRRFTKPINRLLQALLDGVASFRDGDFSVSLASHRDDELGDLVKAHNQMGEVLRAERQNLFQRELLLDTVIQATPVALVLTDASHRIVYSNHAARELFATGKKLEGWDFQAILKEQRPDFAHSLQYGGEGLVTLAQAGEDEVFLVSHQDFHLNARQHELYLFKRLTHELNRQEVATWKKVIRVISHELNNSLAPISSLAHSGATLLKRGETQRLAHIFDTISARSSSLKTFIDGYARFARLPAPQKETICCADFFQSLQSLAEFRFAGGMPEGDLYADPSQLQHVLLNLLKNATESGAPVNSIRVKLERLPRIDRIVVIDQGPGMSESVLQHALLPFYSTKKQGSGLGLPLCREIVEAHGGRMNLSNHLPKGLMVSFTLPRYPPTAASS
jgi:nitrogen fixation/metabolism regulation signal transduction histidine kinase